MHILLLTFKLVHTPKSNGVPEHGESNATDPQERSPVQSGKKQLTQLQAVFFLKFMDARQGKGGKCVGGGWEGGRCVCFLVYLPKYNKQNP